MKSQKTLKVLNSQRVIRFEKISDTTLSLPTNSENVPVRELILKDKMGQYFSFAYWLNTSSGQPVDVYRAF